MRSHQTGNFFRSTRLYLIAATASAAAIHDDIVTIFPARRVGDGSAA